MKALPFRMVLLALVAALATACGPRIYVANDFREYAHRHRTVAVLPALVSTELRPVAARNTTFEQQRDAERRYGLDFQERIYAWLLRRSNQRDYTVQFQDVAQTNALLFKHNLSYEELRARSPQELAQLLGVDAVLTSSVRTSKPVSDGVAVAAAVLTDVWMPTNQATITVNIYEADAGKLLWKYDYLASGTVFSSTETVVNALMRNASRKFPYRK